MTSYKHYAAEATVRIPGIEHTPQRLIQTASVSAPNLSLTARKHSFPEPFKVCPILIISYIFAGAWRNSPKFLA